MRLCRALPILAAAALLAGCSGGGPPAPPLAHAAPHLTFTGAVAGTATAMVDPEPTGDAADADTAPFTTRCAFAAPGSTGAWSAQFTVATPGNTWEIGLGQPGFGDPKPGRYPLWGSTGTAPDGDLGLSVVSAKPIAPYLESAGADSYEYYNPGSGDYATVAAALTSGTIHATLAPDVPGSLTFTIDGTWSCY